MKYTAISDVSKMLLNLFRQRLVPDIIGKPDSIGLCSPDNRGDFQIGIYLYNVEQSESVRLSGRQNENLFYQKYPPIVLDLYYMITPFYKSDVKFLAEEEQVLLGKVIQIINDNSNMTLDGETVILEFCNPTLDDKQKIWGSSSTYKTSIYFSARAVILESARGTEISRVTDITFETNNKQ